jgi:hypothetical protein
VAGQQRGHLDLHARDDTGGVGHVLLELIRQLVVDMVQLLQLLTQVLMLL